MSIVGKRIVRATGYSSKRDVDFNPAIEDVVRAFKSDGVDKSKKNESRIAGLYRLYSCHHRSYFSCHWYFISRNTHSCWIISGNCGDKH